MHAENIGIVVLLVIGIVVLGNLAMFAMVRGSRGVNFDWFKNIRGSFSQPFQKEDDSWDELHKKVEELQDPEKKE